MRACVGLLLLQDMLEVGVQPMTFTESQTHFGMWAITSSPLVSETAS